MRNGHGALLRGRCCPGCAVARSTLRPTFENLCRKTRRIPTTPLYFELGPAMLAFDDAHRVCRIQLRAFTMPANRTTEGTVHASCVCPHIALQHRFASATSSVSRGAIYPPQLAGSARGSPSAPATLIRNIPIVNDHLISCITLCQKEYFIYLYVLTQSQHAGSRLRGHRYDQDRLMRAGPVAAELTG